MNSVSFKSSRVFRKATRAFLLPCAVTCIMNKFAKQPKLLKKHPNAFQVEWKDGHVSWYPYVYLRQMCPCAECAIIRHKGRDVHSLFAPQGDGDITLIEVSDDIQPLDIQLVGRYALQFSWNDGHDTGIYPFEVLRETCPCPECAPLYEKSLIQTEEEN